VTKPTGRNDNMRWRTARAAAIAAAGGVCQLCGNALVPGAPRNSPAETVIDHIWPLSLGGAPYDLANLRATHRRCNGSRRRRNCYVGLVAPPADDWVPIRQRW
jgi:5-methylcytosine-specific restriction endonuclease McrA